jgi:peptidoglycan/xylan/chitin deacetylase (PgdA/CDA1 family)
MDVLMIHDLSEAHFRLPLDRYSLTFDDGLYSQYYYYPLLKAHPRPRTFFITPSLIREAPARGP